MEDFMSTPSILFDNISLFFYKFLVDLLNIYKWIKLILIALWALNIPF